MHIPISSTYTIVADDRLSLEIESNNTSGKVILPKDLINEALDLLRDNSISTSMNPRDIRETLKKYSKWSNHIINQDTHLKALIVFFADYETVPEKLDVLDKEYQQKQILTEIETLKKEYNDFENKKINVENIHSLPTEILSILNTKEGFDIQKSLYIKVGSQGTSHPFDTQTELKEIRGKIFQSLLDTNAKGYFVASKLKDLTDVEELNKENVESIRSNFATHIIFYLSPTKKRLSPLEKVFFTPVQKILYGAPGTGKSHCIEQETKNISYKFRTVFHPEMMFAEFFGSLQPKTKYSRMSPIVSHVSDTNIDYSFGHLLTSQESSSIVYEFSPGPFMRAVRSALHNPNDGHILIIEEINRAHAAAVFGEIFQLLDRDTSGWSKYSIVISDAAYQYLDEQDILKKNELRIPPNLSIYATMNTSDQGVYPMDTAFKRRWKFQYIPLDGKDIHWKQKEWNPNVPILNNMPWQDFRVAVNSFLREQSRLSKIEMPIPEDKLIGPYFLSLSDLEEDSLCESVVEKVLFYLLFDVLKYSPEALCTQNFSMSEVREKADKKELVSIFHADLRTKIPQKEDSQQENLQYTSNAK